MGQDAQEERDLIDRAVGGDRTAFDELARRHFDRVRATAYHVAGNAADADDIAQEALLRAYQRLAAFDGRSRFFTWLYRIVVNTALNHIRSSRRRRDRVDRSTRDMPEAWAREIDDQPDPERRAAARQRYERVLQAMEGLSEALRVVVVMVVLDEIPYADAAEILGIPRGTVAWRLNQARRLLRERMGDAVGGTGASAGAAEGQAGSARTAHSTAPGEPADPAEPEKDDKKSDDVRGDKKSALGVS